MLSKEAQVILATCGRLMAAKMEEPISNVKGWVNGRTAITSVMSYSRILHGARIQSPLHTREPDWDSGLGLAFA